MIQSEICQLSRGTAFLTATKVKDSSPLQAGSIPEGSKKEKKRAQRVVEFQPLEGAKVTEPLSGRTYCGFQETFHCQYSCSLKQHPV